MSRQPLAFTLALRELRGARRGFGIFLACLAVGVMAIAGIGSFARALTEGLEREGRAILGGDVAYNLVQREATPEELATIGADGTVSRVALLRAMARSQSGEAMLVELKAVDGAYPMVGRLDISPAQSTEALLRPSDGAFGAAADEVMMTRLGLGIGSRIQVGEATFEIRARILTEPDKLSSGVGFGARLLVSDAGLKAAGLVQPGSLVRWSYRVALRQPESLPQVMERVKAPLAAAGFEVRTRDAATPQLERNVRRISQFLTLVALTALLVGGVGVANAVSSHLAAKRETIATFKALGATRATIFATYGAEILLIAGAGVTLGLVLGAALPFAAAAAIAALVPFPLAPRLDPGALALAAFYGLTVSALFAVWPLARAQEAPVSTLFRDGIGARLPRPGLGHMVLMAVLAAMLVAVALATSDDIRTAAIFLAASATVFVLLRMVALAIMAVARRLPRPRSTVARLALGNIHRPGALTPTVVLSLGLGLSLMVALALVDRSLTMELSGPMRESAPSFFFVDVPSSQQEAFSAFIKAKAPDGVLKSVPMLRGRITALNGVPADQVKSTPDAAWVLQSDRGISMAAEVPEGSQVVEGQWWGPDTTEPQLSFEDKLAAGLGLKLGDRVSVNVLGRTVTARISNLRRVNWERLGINFVMVFSPNTFGGAPYTVLSTLSFPDGGDTAREVELMKAVAAAYPAVTTVRVKETLEEARRMLENLSLGIRAASLVTLITSVLVLAGALAAGHQHRVYDAVILKTLGATRPRLIAAYGLEYAGLGLVTALFAVAAGGLAAYAVVTQVMEIAFTFSLPAAAGAVAGALALTVGFGLIGTFRALSVPPVRVLRHL
ncbi:MULTISPECIES: FtsX-like permease family protein [unclassified Xanthobacter]|uniref:ABC transporter permease n=1 Tax=unclassified Xanthobacter TaxID=2623496 RepID=UPI001F15D9B3